MTRELDKPNGAPIPEQQHWERTPRPPVVLVAEDHDDTRLLYKFVLELRGYQVVEAANGNDVLKVARKTRPDLVLMDTNLPYVDGLTATKQIRQDASLHDVPIIFISGDAQPEHRAMALAIGGNDYLLKPMSISDLETAVENQLNKRSYSGQRSHAVNNHRAKKRNNGFSPARRRS